MMKGTSSKMTVFSCFEGRRMVYVKIEYNTGRESTFWLSAHEEELTPVSKLTID